MTADERRAQIGDVTGIYTTYEAAPDQAHTPAQAAIKPAGKFGMSHWASYLAKLASQFTQVARPKNWWKMLSSKRPAQGGLEVAETIAQKVLPARQPIGNRRVRLFSRRVQDIGPRVWLSFIPLGIWGYYFSAKLALYGLGVMDFHPVKNLAFAAFVMLPVAPLRRLVNIVAPLLAVALLYHDSWLPPIGRLFEQASLLSDFSLPYLLELIGRFFSWHAAGLLLACAAAYWMLSRWVRVGVLVIVAMMALALVQLFSHGSVADRDTGKVDAVVKEFFASEAKRSVSFTTPQPDAVPFDILFIHVCSLSWDDVLAVGLDQHPLWKRFDFLLTKFNSAASYSGPAAIHLLRGKCGQPTHGSMYTPADDRCYLMSNLQQSGFETELALNHDGKFDDFLGQIRTDGRLDVPPLSLAGLEPAQYAFDKSPVFDDLSVLDRWMENRQKSVSPRVALYYNTVSLHDGNHLSDTNSAPNTLATYKARLSRFLDEMDSFMQKLAQSDRHTVVVMVPEHGAAVRGDKRQIAGLREIPTPSITLVPVGIGVIGGGIKREGEQQIIDQPTSYLAVSTLVEHMLEKSPFTGDTFLPASYAADLPSTRFVSQNEKATVAEYNQHFYYSRGDGNWEHYAEFDKAADK